jgi:hypothetical protein
MEYNAKRSMSDETELKILEPILMRIDKNDCIHIDKNEVRNIDCFFKYNENSI